ncbi:MAG: hypothetical protein ABH832_01805 [bacterium]
MEKVPNSLHDFPGLAVDVPVTGLLPLSIKDGLGQVKPDGKSVLALLTAPKKYGVAKNNLCGKTARKSHKEQNK